MQLGAYLTASLSSTLPRKDGAILYEQFTKSISGRETPPYKIAPSFLGNVLDRLAVK